MNYRLKKDLPDMEAGEIFDDTDSFGHETSSMFDSRGTYRFEKDDIEHFDEWFEKVDESSDWLHNGTIYYRPEVSVYSKRFLPCSDMFRVTEYDIARRRIGFCHESAKSCERFIDFLESVEAVSHDDGFMSPFGKVDEVRYGFGIFCDWEGNLCAEEKKHMVLAGEFYFDNEENAEKSINSHPNEWKVILNYDWSRE